jgi:tetratricopeptide (TPR) repeat protein
MENKNSDDVLATWEIIDIPYIDYIKKSVRIFSRENFKKALSRFEIIFDSYPNDVNANFYSGLCLFNFGEYKNAIESFSKCIDSPFTNFDEESRWMIAMCHENDGNHTVSKKLFKQITDAKGYYASQARDKLNQ